MTKNFISVLITNYNKQKFIKKSLQSIFNQKFKNYEIILFDDVSSDNSKKIIKKFKKIKLIENKKKKSTSSPLNQIYGINKAFKRSKGNLICLMDADDYFKNNKLKIVNKEFGKKETINSLYNLPKISQNKFFLKKNKIFKSIWPTIFPTSCITLSRNSFKKFLKYSKSNDYPNLEIDARITIFYKFYLNEYNVLYKDLTVYNFDKDGITSKVKKYSKNWWFRRVEAYDYLKFIMKEKNINFTPNPDYIITLILSSIFKFLLK